MGTLEAHIRLSDDLGIRYALLAGDPERIGRVAAHLEDVQELAYNREYRSLCGTYQGVRVLAMSTGIGGTSMGIAVEELAHIGIKAAIRIGSAGSYQPGIGLGELIIASGAVRDDGTSKAYIPVAFPAVADPELLSCVIAAAKEQKSISHVGLVRSHDSFYTDQEDEICAYWSKFGILGADMETSALYTIAHLRGIKAASILNNVVLYQSDAGDSIDQYASGDSRMADGERAEILTALETFVRMEGANE
ncbi:MAG: nucleoside phosphorylase [Oscillospiraceae bacterium]|nr:nucleoside phosphorylase [Oscillospiraceae bacterium]